ncbi:transglycosylase domain-containing protein [Lutibacter sp.]|uniref:transglycosylase domain-containing protein n=1 Tax=Lutibacter sp. TaxID=1925666 RepID=UPI0035663AB7
MQFLENPLFKKYLKYFLIAISSLILLSVLFFFAVYIGIFGPLPNKAELASTSNEEATQVISSDNKIIGKYFAQNRTNITWDQVPDHLKNALIATEDKRFFTHRGYDLQSYFRVFFKSVLMGDNKGGGSTLTQQLVKNLYGRHDFSILSMPVNKVKEIIIAARIESLFTKEELLLLYLNSVPFGENLYGIETASQRYFNKPASKLKVEESAVLVGLLKANTTFNPRLNPKNSLERRNMVLDLMEKQAYLMVKEADSLQKLPLKLHYENITLEAPAGYFVHQVKQKALKILENLKDENKKEYNLEKDGLKIYTTLNMQVQKMATDGIQKHLAKMQKVLDKELENRNFKKEWLRKLKAERNLTDKDQEKRNIEVFDWKGVETKKMSKIDSLWHYYKMLNAAVLITNPKNGAVITWVGGNDFRKLPFDVVQSHRQIASAFKPILYATAFEDDFEPCNYMENVEKVYPEYENWAPKNFDYKSTQDSTVALWYSLSHSMNLPTVDLYFKVGREKLLNTCNKLNFPHTKDDAPSIALGTLDLSLFEIVRAYGAFANKGQTTEPVMINKITDASGKILYKREAAELEKVFSVKTSQMITAILQKAINQGTGTRIRNQYGVYADLAGKTGTAQNYTDAWFIAYTPDLVIGTWVGASTPDVHFYSGQGSGSSLALPIVGNVLRGIEQDAKLRKQFLTPFSIPYHIYDDMECDPYHETGITGFFKRLFN